MAYQFPDYIEAKKSADNKGIVMILSEVRRRDRFVNSVIVEAGADASILLVVSAALLISGISRGPAETLVGASLGAALVGILSLAQWRPVFKRSISGSTPAPSSTALENSSRTVLRTITTVGIPATALAAAMEWLWGPGLASYGVGFAGGLWMAMSVVFVGGLIRVRQEEERIGSHFVRAATFHPWGDWREKRSEMTWRFFTMPKTRKV
jgi:hypothetical protein